MYQSNLPSNVQAWSAVSVGDGYTCGIEAGTRYMHCFGLEVNSQITPQAPSSVQAWSAVSAGWSHACGIEAGTGKMHCFGSNSDSRATPPSSVQAWSAVSAGMLHTCGIEAGTGKMHCFGSNSNSMSSPPSSVQAWSAVAVGVAHTCGIEAGTGKMHCFGSNSDSRATPPTSVQAWSAVSAGEYHTCGIEAGTDKMHCFGSSNYNSRTTPPSSVKAWSAVSAGGYHTCGIEAGTHYMHCFGADSDSMSSPPSSVQAWSVPIECIPPVVNFTAVSADRSATLLDLSATSILSQWPIGRIKPILAGWTSLESLVLPADLNELPENFALGAPRLLAIDLSRCSNLTVIPRHSLGTDNGTLIQVQLPDKTAAIEPDAFTSAEDGSGPSGLQSLDLSMTQVSSLDAGVLRGLTGLTSITLPYGLSTIEPDAFTSAEDGSGPSGLYSLDLSMTQVSSLDAGALRGLTGLTSISLPSTISTIEPDAFTSAEDGSGPSSLQSLDLSMTQVSSLDAGVLRGLTGLTSISLPSTISTIEPDAFTSAEDGSGPSGLQSLDLSMTQVSSLDAGVLRGLTGLTSISLPSTISTIEPDAFTSAEDGSGPSGLYSLDLSMTQVSSLDAGALRGLTGLMSISLPSTISTIEPDAFTSAEDGSGPSGLYSLDLSMTQVSSLDAGALRGLTGLTSISLPSSMQEAVERLFEGSVSSLQLSIEAPGLRHLHTDAFSGAHGSPRRLELDTPMLEAGPTGLLVHLEDLTDIALTLGADFTVENGTCGFFDGLDSLASLSIQAPGAQRVFGKTQDLAMNGFRDCAFAGSLRTLDLQGLDLRRSVWTETTFAGLTGLTNLRVEGSSGDRSFTLLNGALSPLISAITIDLSDNGIEYLPQLSFTANDAMEAIDFRNNPISTSHAEAFANLFALSSVNVSDTVGITCNAGTFRSKVDVLGNSLASRILCVECPAGAYCEDGVRAQECPKGTYSEVRQATASSDCVYCPEGTTTVGTGTSSASDCIAVVTSCPVGMAGLTCEPCLPGTSSPGGNVQSCVACEPGTVSSSMYGSFACSKCPPATYMPYAGAALTSSCIKCGAGLSSDSGSASCSGCPGGSLLDSSNNECVDLPTECSEPGTMCLPGVPEPVPAVAVLQESMADIPLPGAAKGAFASASTGSYSTSGSSRRLQMDPEVVVDPKVMAGLRGDSVAARRLQEPGQGDSNGEPEDGASDGDTSNDDASGIVIIAWIMSTCVLCVLLLLLLVPSARPTMHSGLRMIDSMAQEHKPVEYAAVRRIATAMGGWFTVMAVLVALTSSTTLVLDFAYRNSITTDGLQVATAGASGAGRAASAMSNMALDAVLSPTSLAACNESYLLTVSSGRASLSSAPLAGDAPAHSMLQLAATATVQELSIGNQQLDRPLCWLRATCDDCGLSAVTSLDLDTHWAVQAISWRLATQDAGGRWSSVSGTAVSPSADPLTSNATMHLQEMLDARSEQMALVGHVLDDTRTGSSRSVEGFRVQDLRSGATSTRSVDAIDPASTVTRLSIRVSRAGVFATTSITPAYTLAQVASSILGLTVGILGGFKAAFAVFERVFGPKMEWLCGRTGLVDTEEEAAEHRREAAGPSSRPETASKGKCSTESGDRSTIEGNRFIGRGDLYGQSPMWPHGKPVRGSSKPGTAPGFARAAHEDEPAKSQVPGSEASPDKSREQADA